MCAENGSEISTQPLPGIQIWLPRWESKSNERTTVPGHVALRAPDGTGSLYLSWASGTRARQEDLDRYITTKGHDKPTLEWVSVNRAVMPLWTMVKERSGHPVAQSTWLCTRPYVRFFLYLRSSSDPEALHKLASRMLGSVRCDSGTLEVVRIRHVPRLACEMQNCFTLPSQDGTVRMSGSDSTVYELRPGRF